MRYLKWVWRKPAALRSAALLGTAWFGFEDDDPSFPQLKLCNADHQRPESSSRTLGNALNQAPGQSPARVQLGPAFEPSREVRLTGVEAARKPLAVQDTAAGAVEVLQKKFKEKTSIF